MSENSKGAVSIANLAGDVLFAFTGSEMEAAIEQDKGGENFYLLQYHLEQDLAKSKIAETLSDLKDFSHLVTGNEEESLLTVLISTVLEDDMIDTFIDIKYGSILKFDQEGQLIGNLLEVKEDAFSIVDDDELANIDLEILEEFGDGKGDYVDAAELLVDASKKLGCDTYNRKDVLEKFAEEKRKSS